MVGFAIMSSEGGGEVSAQCYECCIVRYSICCQVFDDQQSRGL